MNKYTDREEPIFDIYFMKWKENEIEILKNYYSLGTEFLMGKIVGRSSISITHQARRLGLKISQETKIKICKFNASKKRGKKENYRVGDITQDIDEYSSYVLGLLWTDGYIIKNRNSIGITMIKDDISTIEWIFKKTGNWYVQNRKRKNKRESMTLTAYNPILYDKLITLDYDKKSIFGPDKVYPLIPKKYIKYFFRGIIDGDGCFYVNIENKSYQLSIASTYDQDWSFYIDIFSSLGYTFKISRRKSKKGNSSIIRMCSKKKAAEFINWIYNGYETDIIGLYRKYVKSLLFLK